MINSLLKILLIEDDIDYASLLKLRLTRVPFQKAETPQLVITHVQRMAEAEETLHHNVYDLVLLDMSLPDVQEMEGFLRLKAVAPSLPIVVLTATDEDDLAFAALQLGAQDYLVKDESRSELLLRAIHHTVRRSAILSKLESKYATELLASEQEFCSLVEHIADGIAIIDQASSIRFFNAAFARLLHRSAEECTNQPLGYSYTLNTTTEIEVRDCNGLLCTLEMRVSPMPWRRQEAYLVSLRDISAQKRTALAMEQYARELEVHNEDLDAFAHTVAHNLRAPLTHIILAADLLDLNKHAMSIDCSNYVGTIVNYGRKLTEIIDDLLLLAEVRAREELLLLPLDMARVVRDVELRLKLLITQYNGRIIIADADKWPQVMGYAPWIEEVWTNYITNGLKYGGRPPRLEIGAIPLSNGLARFWVRDNGDGITTEEQQSLFQPFARLKGPGAENYGLGLSIVRRIIEKLGGQVAVESRLGIGSEFSFFLPLA